jgi:hypothetical protein
MSTPTIRWEGQHNSDQHRTCGGRAWCLSCCEWCYPDDWCECCHYSAGHVKAWLNPDGSQVAEG